MPTTTLKQLRALARSRGLRGYSKLSRPQLERLLGQAAETPARQSKKSAGAKSPSRSETKKPARPKNSAQPLPKSPARPAATAPQSAETTATPTWTWAHAERTSNEEQQVESAKYAHAPSDIAPPVVTTDLGEDIDRLPEPEEATLCLLPQKPGVLHGYWSVPAHVIPPARALRLRLGRIRGETLEILDEIALPQAHGRWYFHVDGSADPGIAYLHLGYYEADGRFVTATRRGIARIPSLYASERTDRLWWVSEELFRAMYHRAGGRTGATRLGWSASIGSPGAPPGAPSSERLAWAGNRSS